MIIYLTISILCIMGWSVLMCMNQYNPSYKEAIMVLVGSVIPIFNVIVLLILVINILATVVNFIPDKKFFNE